MVTENFHRKSYHFWSDIPAATSPHVLEMICNLIGGRSEIFFHETCVCTYDHLGATVCVCVQVFVQWSELILGKKPQTTTAAAVAELQPQTPCINA